MCQFRLGRWNQTFPMHRTGLNEASKVCACVLTILPHSYMHFTCWKRICMCQFSWGRWNQTFPMLRTGPNEACKVCACVLTMVPHPYMLKTHLCVPIHVENWEAYVFPAQNTNKSCVQSLHTCFDLVAAQIHAFYMVKTHLHVQIQVAKVKSDISHA